MRSALRVESCIENYALCSAELWEVNLRDFEAWCATSSSGPSTKSSNNALYETSWDWSARVVVANAVPPFIVQCERLNQDFVNYNVEFEYVVQGNVGSYWMAISGLISLQAKADLVEDRIDRTERQWRSIVGIVNKFAGVVGVKRSLKPRESSPAPLFFTQLKS